MNDFRIILRSLRVRLFSTLVTLCSVAIAVGLLMSLLILRTSGEKAFARGTGNASLLVSRDASPLESVLNGIFYANPPRNPIPMEKYKEIVDSFPWAWTVPTQLGDSYQGLPVVATSFCIVAVFLPVGLMPGISGQFFKNFGITVVIAVLMSLAVARMITPMLAAYFLKSKGHAEHGEGPVMDRYMGILHWSLERGKMLRRRDGIEPPKTRFLYMILLLATILLLIAITGGVFFVANQMIGGLGLAQAQTHLGLVQAQMGLGLAQAQMGLAQLAPGASGPGPKCVQAQVGPSLPGTRT